MTDAQHTPGPWHTTGTGRQRCIVYDASGYPVSDARMLHRHTTAEQAQANATLQAAAPQMLAVLQELRECAHYWSEYHVPLGIVERIDAAIMAATQVRGEPQC